MHRSLVRLVALSSLALGAQAFLQGCQIGPVETGSTHGKNVQHAATGIDRSIGLIDATVNSAEELVAKPAADPAPQFQVFDKNLDLLVAIAQDVGSLATDMQTNSKAYIAEWDRQIAAMSDEDDRTDSAERRKEVSDSLAALGAEYARARDEFRPLVQELEGIRSALAANLSPSGIEAVKAPVGKLDAHAAKVKETLTALSAHFRELGVDIKKLPPTP